MTRRRNLIWLVPLLFFATFPAWRIPVTIFLQPHLTKGTRPPVSRHQDFNMEKVRILQNKNGKMTAEIRAERAATTTIPNEYTLEDVNADIFGAGGEATGITARNGVFNGNDQQLTLIDNVVIVNENDGQRLYTDLLVYDDKKRLVKSPDKTRIEGDGVTISGTGLVHDLNQGTYELGGRVRCLLTGSFTP